MGKKLQFRKETLSSEHAAISMWQTLGITRLLPSSVEQLTNRKGRPLNRKSRIYRLKGGSVPGGSIIAKRGPSDTIETERLVYDEILPLIEIPSLRCYGYAQESSEFAWIFLQEAHGVKYDYECFKDQQLAAKTLASIHTATSEMDLASKLPKHDLRRYEHCILTGRDLIIQNLGNSALSDNDKQLLDSILSQFDQVEKLWTKIDMALAEMPQCLVHGDFVGKNVFVDKSQEPCLMYVMDWDIAGWGAPAFDMENISPSLYAKYCASRWQHIGQEQIIHMALIGRILRNVGLIQATSSGLCYDWLEDVISKLASYERVLSESLNSFLGVKRVVGRFLQINQTVKPAREV